MNAPYEPPAIEHSCDAWLCFSCQQWWPVEHERFSYGMRSDGLWGRVTPPEVDAMHPPTVAPVDSCRGCEAAAEATIEATRQRRERIEALLQDGSA